MSLDETVSVALRAPQDVADLHRLDEALETTPRERRTDVTVTETTTATAAETAIGRAAQMRGKCFQSKVAHSDTNLNQGP